MWQMKKQSLLLAGTLALSLVVATPVHALDSGTPEAIAADVILARPACLVATAAGAVVFVVALPFAAMSKSVKKTARTLVVRPAQATFTRELGELNAIPNYGRKQVDPK